jgi:predicted nucleic acid-binding protein
MDAPLIHLDTGFAIRALQDGSPEDVEFNRLVARGVRLGISAIAWSEFLCGPLDERHPDLIMRVVGEPVPVLAIDAKLAAEFFNLSGRRRGHLTDCMIAATAVRVGAALATTNADDFRKCRGLRLSYEA